MKLPTPSKFLLLFLVPVAFSCKKDIDIDYHQVDPIYVVEASISNSGTKVRISQTNDMDNNSSNSDINQAKVTITSEEGKTYDIPFYKNGVYRLTTLKGVADIDYQIDVDLDGRHFSSTSTMQREPKMNEFRFVWKKVASERIMFGDLRIQDIPNTDSWYFLHIYRNNIGYRWAVIRDDQNPNKELQQLFAFFREGSSDDDVLQEGDRLHIDIRAIDQRAYDYLYSMQLMNDTGTNPLQNFTGGCLGYFTAYNQISYDCVYHAADAEEE